MKLKTNIKAGRLAANHNEKVARPTAKAGGLKVRTKIKAGKLAANHNERLASRSRG